ncbi:MAG: L,D-transpeptidase family protein [SAR324 cluster bacterium]|nr:L,D-transpeptidase family protein [SAR324 cluster bacterium]
MKRLCLFSVFIVLALPLWGQTVPDNLVLYETPGSTIILVNKSKCSLNVFQKQNYWKKVRQYECTTGKSKGDKQSEGDLKTPNGLYFLTNNWTDKELIRRYGTSAKIYGAGAFELNYPNHLDQVLYKKNGYGIWLHGTDKELPSATRGCISTTNTDLQKIAQYISLRKTPLIIEEEITYTQKEEIQQIRLELLDFIERWRVSWESENTNHYLSFYSKIFRTHKFNYQKWKKFKRFINEQNQDRKIAINEISILKAKDIFHVEFIQDYTSTQTTDIGRKTLYIVKEDQGYRIISETWDQLKKEPSSSSSHYVYKQSGQKML